MKIGVAGSIGRDHLFTFSGKFTDSMVAGSLDKISLSFLVDDLVIHRGGTGANIAFGLGVLGANPVLIAAAGTDWSDYEAWLSRHGVNTEKVKVSQNQHTAIFMVTTDSEMNQIASFYPGATSEAREIELAPIHEAIGGIDLLIVSPDDPEAMLRHTEVAHQLGISIIADPSQQLAWLDGEKIRALIDGATYLFMNEYELGIAIQKTGWSDSEILDRVKYRVVTMGSDGARIESKSAATISITVPQEKGKVDPTGVGDAFRSGFIAGLSWGLSHQLCAQVGAMLATYVIETKGTQEYRFSATEFLDRFAAAYGGDAAKEVGAHLVKSGFDR
jgi:adenosine kinase